MSYSQKIARHVEVVDGILHLHGQAVTKFEVTGKLGQGANGVVFDARHKLLDRPRAVKVWLKLRGGDKRDKIAQGIAEAQKLAAADPLWVAMVYEAEIIAGTFFTAMEKINGVSLRAYLNDKPSKYWRWMAAARYVDAIDQTTTESVVHGDPHAGNVMVTLLRNYELAFYKEKNSRG
ncbi:protein kinase [Bradyrhizobium sp. USDA 223]|uniref:protein kinase n=1 Tax=Bradyrhizobium sp. USDA 223 TaxID=3156306 RepID=UPI003839A05D